MTAASNSGCILDVQRHIAAATLAFSTLVAGCQRASAPSDIGVFVPQQASHIEKVETDGRKQISFRLHSKHRDFAFDLPAMRLRLGRGWSICEMDLEWNDYVEERADVKINVSQRTVVLRNDAHYIVLVGRYESSPNDPNKAGAENQYQFGYIILGQASETAISDMVNAFAMRCK